MKKISKEELKIKILQVLDIAPYLQPEDLYLAMLKQYPLGAVEQAYAELKKEGNVEEEVKWEFDEEKKEK